MPPNDGKPNIDTDFNDGQDNNNDKGGQQSTSDSPSSPSGSSPSSTSSGTSSSAQGATDQDRINSAVASYLAIITGWQMKITPTLKKLATYAAQKGMSSAWFLQQVRRTKDYAKRFPGIANKKGVMRMTEAQYISGYLATRDYAASLGRNISKEAYGAAIAQGNSPSEIKLKLTVNDKLKSFGPQFQEFNEYLVSTGQIKKPLEKKDLQDFLMGYRKDLEQAWTVANTAFKMQELAEVEVGRPKEGNDVSFRELKSMLNRYQALGGDPEQIDFVQMGALISNVIPKSDLYGMGITKKKIVGMMLNGKDAPEVTAKVQQVLDTYEAAVSEPAAHAIGYAGQQNLGTPRGRGE